MGGLGAGLGCLPSVGLSLSLSLSTLSTLKRDSNPKLEVI